MSDGEEIRKRAEALRAAKRQQADDRQTQNALLAQTHSELEARVQTMLASVPELEGHWRTKADSYSLRVQFKRIGYGLESPNFIEWHTPTEVTADPPYGYRIRYSRSGLVDADAVLEDVKRLAAEWIAYTREGVERCEEEIGMRRLKAERERIERSKENFWGCVGPLILFPVILYALAEWLGWLR